MTVVLHDLNNDQPVVIFYRKIFQAALAGIQAHMSVIFTG
jgi:hypothetical protein